MVNMVLVKVFSLDFSGHIKCTFLSRLRQTLNIAIQQSIKQIYFIFIQALFPITITNSLVCYQFPVFRLYQVYFFLSRSSQTLYVVFLINQYGASKSVLFGFFRPCQVHSSVTVKLDLKCSYSIICRASIFYFYLYLLFYHHY